MNGRRIYRDFSHIQEHIENARKNLMEGFDEEPKCTDCEKVKARDRTGEICMDLDLALGMVLNAIAREQKATREHD